MQTASTFADVLGVESIKINCMLAKWMRAKNRTKQEQEKDFNPFNHLIISQFDQSKKKEFVDKFLNGVDFHYGSNNKNERITDSKEYDFVRQRFPETID